MMNKWSIDTGEFRIAQSKLELVSKGVLEPKGENNRQAWIHQKEINKRLISLIEQLKKKMLIEEI